ncbi:MAG: hypothetical protein K2G55_16190, partial [Lachnospiraceae bacterium]|nr:hypothetical protein [Lachnospiraceae bacterium]
HHGCSPLFERILYMNFLIFASFPIICLIFSFALHNANRKEQEIDREFWDREQRANFTRKKPLDNLNYITIPEELLTMNPDITNEEIAGCLKDLNDLSSLKIVNLTGYTNTDLKLEYGTANITILSDYDFHYTKLVTLLQKLAELLHDSLEDELAIKVLEFSISTGTDVSKSYYLLAELYQQMNTPEKIKYLIAQAQNINSLMKDTIVENLQAAYRSAC